MLQVSVQADFLLIGFLKTEQWETREQIQVARALWEQFRLDKIRGFITPRAFDRICSALASCPNAQEVITSIRSVLEILPHDPALDAIAAISGKAYDCAVEVAYANEYELDGIVANSSDEFSELSNAEVAIFLPGALLLELQEIHSFQALSPLQLIPPACEAPSTPEMDDPDQDQRNSLSTSGSSDEEILLEVLKQQAIASNSTAVSKTGTHQPEQNNGYTIQLDFLVSRDATPKILPTALAPIRYSSSLSSQFEALDFSSFWLPVAIAVQGNPPEVLSSQSATALTIPTTPIAQYFTKQITTTIPELPQSVRLNELKESINPTLYLQKASESVVQFVALTESIAKQIVQIPTTPDNPFKLESKPLSNQLSEAPSTNKIPPIIVHILEDSLQVESPSSTAVSASTPVVVIPAIATLDPKISNINLDHIANQIAPGSEWVISEPDQNIISKEIEQKIRDRIPEMTELSESFNGSTFVFLTTVFNLPESLPVTSPLSDPVSR